MSLQLALSAALSGLKASQQQAALLSHNIANATTPGYVRKDLQLASASIGGTPQGVRVEGVGRNVDEYLIRDARFAQGGYSGLQARADALSTYTDAIGQPQDESSVAAMVGQFQQAFQRLFDMPESDGARAAVVDKAQSVCNTLHAAATAATNVQNDARDRLAAAVTDVNSTLVKVSQLNTTIATQTANGQDASDLVDQRDQLLDHVSEQIGIRTFTRDDNQVVVMTRNGATLVDGELQAGAQPIQLVGHDLVVRSASSPVGDRILTAAPDQEIQSGQILGLYKVAEQDMPRFMSQLDSLATGLATGFQGAEADPTQAGIFTDAGNAPVSGATPAGLASRLQVDTDVAANVWKVQSGAQAATPLASGDQTQVRKFLDVFDQSLSFSAAGLPGSSRIGDYATSLVSTQQSDRASAKDAMNAGKVTSQTLQTARTNRDGVNIDDEMQKLTLVEQSYSASAQVIQAAGKMIDALLAIGTGT